MTIARRIFVSSPRDEYLDDRRNQLKWAIVNEIETLGYEAQMFGSPEGGRGLARQSWSPKNADEVMQRCVGGHHTWVPDLAMLERFSGRESFSGN